MPARVRTQPVRIIWLNGRGDVPADLLAATTERRLLPRTVSDAPAAMLVLLREWVEDVVTVGDVDAERRDEMLRTLNVYFPGVRIHHWQELKPATAEGPQFSKSLRPAPPASPRVAADAAAPGPDADQLPTASAPTPSLHAATDVRPAPEVTHEELAMLFGPSPDRDRNAATGDTPEPLNPQSTP